MLEEEKRQKTQTWIWKHESKPTLVQGTNDIVHGSHGNIHTFKNYFATVFSISTKIICIQTDPRFMTFGFYFFQKNSSVKSIIDKF